MTHPQKKSRLQTKTSDALEPHQPIRTKQTNAQDTLSQTEQSTEREINSTKLNVSNKESKPMSQILPKRKNTGDPILTPHGGLSGGSSFHKIKTKDNPACSYDSK